MLKIDSEGIEFLMIALDDDIAVQVEWVRAASRIGFRLEHRALDLSWQEQLSARRSPPDVALDHLDVHMGQLLRLYLGASRCLSPGKSDKSHAPSAYGSAMGEDVVRLLDHLGIQRAHIVGYSMGARITSWLIVNRPDRLMSATLGASTLLGGHSCATTVV